MSTSASPRRSRIAHFKTAFIFSIAAPTALNLACGGKTDSSTTDAEQTGAEQADAEQAGAEQTDAEQAGAEQTGAEQADERQPYATREPLGAEDLGDSQVGFCGARCTPGALFPLARRPSLLRGRRVAG